MSIKADLAEYHDHLAMTEQLQPAQLVWNAIELIKEYEKDLKEIANKNSDMALTIEKLENLCKEADEYLSTNNLTSIGHGSILHNRLHTASTPER
jgi:hypothetical protein